MPNKYVASYYKPGPGASAIADPKVDKPLTSVTIEADNIDEAQTAGEDYFGVASRGGAVTVQTAETAAKNGVNASAPDQKG